MNPAGTSSDITTTDLEVVQMRLVAKGYLTVVPEKIGRLVEGGWGCCGVLLDDEVCLYGWPGVCCKTETCCFGWDGFYAVDQEGSCLRVYSYDRGGGCEAVQCLNVHLPAWTKVQEISAGNGDWAAKGGCLGVRS